jgi:uncharacterized protein DUF4331
MSHHYSGPEYGFPHGDARLDLTDLYAFPKPGDASKSILIMVVHPSDGVNPPGPTDEPFASKAVYELKIDTDGDLVANIAYRGSLSPYKDRAQTATLRRVGGADAAGTGDDGQIVIEGAPVSMGREARVTGGGGYRFFAGWRSDPFFFDTTGALNDLQFTGDDFFAEKHLCTIEGSAHLVPLPWRSAQSPICANGGGLSVSGDQHPADGARLRTRREGKRCVFSARPAGPDACRSAAWRCWFR